MTAESTARALNHIEMWIDNSLKIPREEGYEIKDLIETHAKAAGIAKCVWCQKWFPVWVPYTRVCKTCFGQRFPNLVIEHRISGLR